MSGFVLDASVTLAWLFDDESHRVATDAFIALEKDGAIVPPLWHYEIRNALIVAERRKRLTHEDALERLEAVSELPIQVDDIADFDRAFVLARKYQLSFYDASYLELATRRKLPLASLDKHLVGAATAGENLPLI